MLIYLEMRSSRTKNPVHLSMVVFAGLWILVFPIFSLFSRAGTASIALRTSSPAGQAMYLAFLTMIFGWRTEFLANSSSAAATHALLNGAKNCQATSRSQMKW